MNGSPYGGDQQGWNQNQWNEPQPGVYQGQRSYQDSPDQPRRQGPPLALIVAGVIGALVLIVGGVFAGIVLGGSDDGQASIATTRTESVDPASTSTAQPTQTETAPPPTQTVTQPPAETVTVTRTVPPSRTSTTSADDPRIPASGSYSGQAWQSATANGGEEKTYPVRMTFSGTGSTVEYPDLGCTATLAPDGFSGVDRVYREELTAGSCDDGGTWRVTVRGPDSLSATYRPKDGDYSVEVDLES